MHFLINLLVLLKNEIKTHLSLFFLIHNSHIKYACAHKQSSAKEESYEERKDLRIVIDSQNFDHVSIYVGDLRSGRKFSHLKVCVFIKFQINESLECHVTYATCLNILLSKVECSQSHMDGRYEKYANFC